MYCTKKITEDLTWVGGNDRRLAMFEGVYSVPYGVSYNSYLLNDEKTVLRYYMKNSSTKSIREIAPLLKMSEYRMRNAVASLEKEHFIKKMGSGKATHYILESESMEKLTQMQIQLENLKSRI